MQKWDRINLDTPSPIFLYCNGFIGGDEWTFVHNSLFWVMEDAVTSLLRTIERNLHNAR